MLTQSWFLSSSRPVKIFAVGVLYFVTGKLGLLLALPPGVATAVWPPSGIALAATLLWGYPVWPGIWLGSFLVNIGTLFDGAGVLSTVASLGVVSGIATGSTLQAILAAFLIRQVIGSADPFLKAGDVAQFVGLVMGSCLVASLFGTTSLAMGGYIALSDYPVTWLTWWLGDLIGILLIAPLLLVGRRELWTRWEPRRLLEALVLLVWFFVVVRMVFAGQITPLPFPIIPFVVWAAFRFGVSGVSLLMFLLTGMAIESAVHQVGPFARETLNESLLLLQSYIGVIGTTGMMLAAALTEHRQAEEQFRGVVESAPNAIVVVDQRGSITLVNTETEKLFGYTRKALIGQPVEMLVPERFRAQHPGHRAAFFGSPSTRPMGMGRDLYGLHKDGREFPVEIGLNPIMTSEGRQVRATITDITERKRAEEAVRASEQRLRVALAAGRMGTFEWNISTGRVTWSESLEVIHGLQPGTFGGTFEDFRREIHPEDLKSVLAEIQSALAARRDYHVIYRMKRPDGALRWLEAFGSFLLDARGEPERLAGVCMDVTQRKEAEETIRKLSTPVLPIRPKLLILPIIGEIDQQRVGQLKEQLLSGIRTHRAKVVVMDITGVASMDADIVRELIGLVESARLMGATVILTGVANQFSATILSSDIKLDVITSLGDLQRGIEEAERMLGKGDGDREGHRTPPKVR
jgi:PAS domain S-box-containing protein